MSRGFIFVSFYRKTLERMIYNEKIHLFSPNPRVFGLFKTIR